MNDTKAYLLMEQQSSELRCGGLSGISSSDQHSTWLPSSAVIGNTTNHGDAAFAPSDPTLSIHHHHHHHHQLQQQKSTPVIMTPPSLHSSQRRYSIQSSPTSPSVNSVMVVDIPTSSSSSSSSSTSSSSSPNAITPLSATTPSASSTCSPPPTHYWSSSASSTTSTLYQNHPQYRQQQHHQYDQSSLPPTPVQYHQSPFMQSPIVSTTRSHSVKRNKLRQSTYTRWSLEEDECLKQAVAMHGPHKWSLIASHVPNRTPMQCSTRWLGALNPNIHKGRWTEYEDNILKYSVLEYANVMDNQGRIQPIPWNRIADRIPNRTGIQCQARWTEALDPYVRKGKWGADEDQLLRSGVKEHGRCWIRIAETIPGRTQRQCRTRWMQLQCKHSKQQQQQQQQQQQKQHTPAQPSIDTSILGRTPHLPYSSPSSMDDAVSPISTDDDTTILTTTTATNTTNYKECLFTEKAPGWGDYDNAVFRQHQQQQVSQSPYQQQPSMPMTYQQQQQQQPIKQIFHPPPPLHSSPSDVYSYFNQLSHTPTLFNANHLHQQ